MNSRLGTVERISPSFGPFFTERALPSGRGAASLGLTFRAATFSRLQGADLTSGSFPVNASRPAGCTQPNDVDTIALELGTQTLTLFGTYGVTDRLDLGAAVPVVSNDVEGRRVNTFRNVSSLQAAETAHATGLGDMALRARYTLAGVETMRWLPEGDGVHQVLASSAMKVNIAGSYLLTASLLFRVTDLGLAARVVPAITLDYTFDR